eukprot:m.166603 g.166603  ORF g.166603 m.166603 type:complete len:414 (+) comp13453_c0_seq1:95-1336(+)
MSVSRAKFKDEMEGEFTCTYRGFVHADTNDARALPKLESVEKAFEMLDKKHIKKTRKIHPLFGRGFDTPLTMKVFTSALRVEVSGEKGAKASVVMNTQLHKVAFLAAVGKGLGVIVKRPGIGKFKCHLFMFKGKDGCQEASKCLIRTTNKAFKLLNTVSRKLRFKRIKEGPPELVARKVVSDEEQPWFHGPMSRKKAETILLNFDAINGLYLVRQREGKPNEFVVSFVVEGDVYHNKAERNDAGEIINSKGTKFDNLRTMIALYQNKHEDMQVILTEYVPRGQEGRGDAEYANADMINEIRAMKMESKGSHQNNGLTKWSTIDIQSAISDLEADYDNPDYNDEDGEYATVSEDLVDFDPIYDDVRFGFGNEFVNMVMTGDTNVPTVEDDVDLNAFDGYDLTQMLGGLDDMEEC